MNLIYLWISLLMKNNRTTAKYILATSLAFNQSFAFAESQEKYQDTDIIVVNATLPAIISANAHTISAEDLEKTGATDFGTIMRYEPLIGATGSGSGSGTGKSGFDRGGYTGYNIRGMESNRVGLDVNGIPLPEATGRSYAGRAGVNTFGIGRDYIDPWMYSEVDIQSGVTTEETSSISIGGNVSFLSKSADDYLSTEKHTYEAYSGGWNSSNQSWHNAVALAGGDDELRGILLYSRRDGNQSKNNSGSLPSYPENWHSDAMLLSGIWQTDSHKITGIADLYQKVNHTLYDSWDFRGSAINGFARQSSHSRRTSLVLKDEWTPENYIDSIESQVYYQRTNAHDATNSFTTEIMRNHARRDKHELIHSDYNTSSLGIKNKLTKNAGINNFNFGTHIDMTKTKRPFSQYPLPAIGNIMKPEADSKNYTLSAFIQDNIRPDIDGNNKFSFTPGINLIYHSVIPENLQEMTTGSLVLSKSDVSDLYYRSTYKKVLPSLSLQYDLKNDLTTYIQYRKGVQFPTTSQLYGSWNLGSSYAGKRQYALTGSPELNMETSDNFEWGMKGNVVDGIDVSTSLFYNTYQNFIAYTRYTRTANPDKFKTVPGNIYTTFQAENRDKAYIYGGELKANINYGTWFKNVDGLKSLIALGYSSGKSKSDYLGDKYIDLDSVAPMKAVAGLSYNSPEQIYGTSLTATFVKGKKAKSTQREYYKNDGTSIKDGSIEYMRVPGYSLIDWNAWYKISKNVKLNGGIYNITNKKYWDYLSSRNIETSSAQDEHDKMLSVMPGRTYQLGVNIEF